jgi:putative lipoprotein
MRTRLVIAFLCSATLLGACGGGSKEGGRALPAVTGTVAFDERVALPPDAVLNVRLVDASNINQKAQVMSSTVVSPLGRPPIAFAVEYERKKIDSARNYTIEADIRQGTDVLFLTGSRYGVLTQGKGNHVDLVMISARAPKEEKDPKDVAAEQFQMLQTQIGGMTRVTGERFVGETAIGWDAFLKEGAVKMVRENLEVNGDREAARYAYKDDKPWIAVQETTGKSGKSRVLLAWDADGELIVRNKTRGEKSDDASDAEVERLSQQAKDAFAAVSETRHPKKEG